MSGIPGPGRLVGELIRTGGRRLEDRLGRVATRMGFGPNAAIWRFLLAIGDIHDRTGCNAKLNFKRLDPSFPTLLRDTIVNIPDRCAECRHHLMVDDGPDSECSDAARTMFDKLVVYLQSNDLTSRLLSMRYLQALAEMHWGSRERFFLHRDVESAVQTVLKDAEGRMLLGHADFAAIISPARQTLALLYEVSGPNLPVWSFLCSQGELHDRSSCFAKLDLSGLDTSPPVLLETVQKMRGFCSQCRRHFLMDYESPGDQSATFHAADTLLTELHRYLQMGDFTSQLLSVEYVHALAEMDRPLRARLFEHWDGLSALRVILAHAKNRALEGHVDWGALRSSTQRTLALLSEVAGPTLLAMRYLKHTADIHDLTSCNAKLNIDLFTLNAWETSQKLGKVCARCNRSYYSLTSGKMCSDLILGLVDFVSTKEFENQLLSAQYMCMFMESHSELRSRFYYTKAILALGANLEHARDQVGTGRVEWEALIPPTQQALALVENRQYERMW